MGLFSEIDNPPTPFWNRRTVGFAAAGLLCYGLSRWLLRFDSLWILVLTSIFRLAPLLLITRSKRAWPLLFAIPYPVDLAFAGYSERGRWLSEDLAMEISSPTAFLIWMGAALLISIPLTTLVIRSALSSPGSGQLRYLAGLLFWITAAAVITPVPQWSMFILRNVGEPVALAGFAAVLGYKSK